MTSVQPHFSHNTQSAWCCKTSDRGLEQDVTSLLVCALTENLYVTQQMVKTSISIHGDGCISVYVDTASHIVQLSFHLYPLSRLPEKIFLIDES